jgi:hypothetical protein
MDVPRVPQVQSSPTTRALAITAFTATTALGRGRDAQARALLERRGGLRRNDFGDGVAGERRLDTWIGRVDGLEDTALPDAFARLDCRNNRLAWLALQQDAMAERVDELRARHGAGRVALVLGTSTSSIGATEDDLRRAYGERITLVEESLKTSRLGLANLRQSLLSLLRKAADLELQSKPVSKALTGSIVRQHGDLLRQQVILEQQRQDRQSLGSDLEQALARYRALKAPGKDATQG